MPEYWRFHVRLLNVEANLWRRFLLKKAATFADLHRAIQDACGWEDCHLFAFRLSSRGAVIATIPSEDAHTPEPDVEGVKVSSYFGAPGKKSCIYQYDFGDDWMHKLTLEGVEKHSLRFERRLLGGAGAFPPEDCGGSYGYQRCRAVKTGEQKGDAEFLEWLGDWHPDSFNLQAAAAAFDC